MLCASFLINVLRILVVYNPHLPLRKNKRDPETSENPADICTDVDGWCVRTPRRSMEREVISLQRAQFKDALKINVKT